MAQVVMGLFTDAQEAEMAVDKLNEQLPEVQEAAVHEADNVRGQTVALGGTRSLYWGFAGGCLVALVAGAISGLFVFPLADIPSSAKTVGLTMVMASIFGIIAGIVAGTTEGKAQLRQTAAQARLRGETMVLCEVTARRHVAKVRQVLSNQGAHQVQAA